MPSALFIVLCLGINIGILIGRRSWDILEWGQAAFMTIVAWLIVSPILREMSAKLKNDGDR